MRAKQTIRVSKEVAYPKLNYVFLLIPGNKVSTMNSWEFIFLITVLAYILCQVPFFPREQLFSSGTHATQ